MKRAVKALVALVAGMLVLSGCAGQNPNHAAIIDGVAIPISEADAAFAVLEPYLQPPATPAKAVGVLVTSRVGAQVAARLGLEFSAEERAATTASVLPPDLAADPNAAVFTDDYVTLAMVSQQLGQEAFLKAASEIEVVVNPRFGTWDPEQLTVVAGGGSLSSPAPAS